jgi:CelD/BcsL family acetyltransferase involved in cellulose biosynthesis
MKRARIVAGPDASLEASVRAKWDQLLDQYSSTTLFYQSPEYFSHLAKVRVDCAYLAIVEGDDGEPIGIVPMRKSSVLLKFEVRKHHFASVSFSAIRILGGTLLAPQSPEVFALLFQQIARSFPDCDAMEVSGLSTTSSLWNFLRNSRSLKRNFTIYAPNGPRRCHTARVPDSYTEYLGAFGRKKQYNLRRQIRRLDHFGNGSLALHRIDRVSGGGRFQNARVALGEHAKRDSDQQNSEIEVLDLAERGLLLSYVLSVDGRTCGLAFGTRFRDTLVLHHFRHDAQIGYLSPGTVLHTLMMKDLAEHKLVRRIDYGFGEPRYRLTNDLDERVTAVMVRKGLINQSLIGTHFSYVRLVDGVKRAFAGLKEFPYIDPRSP